MLLPLMLSESSESGSRFLVASFTVLRWVFMYMSTPVIVPWTVEPFLSSIETVSLFSFIKNLYRV
jgi:hypothetical protein